MKWGLDVSYNQISDISPVQNLTDLTWIFLSHNLLDDDDLQALYNLDKLQTYTVEGYSDEESYFDLRGNGNLSREAIVALANELPYISYEEILWDGKSDAGEFNMLKAGHKLYRNFPNPFNPETIIRFQLKNEAWVKLEVFDISGRRTAVLIDDDQMSPGIHEKLWNGGNQPSGTYFYKLTINDSFSLKRKMLLLK